MLGANFVEWHPFDHPTYGPIELGGFVKESQRVPPPFLLEELCHRNTAFVLYHADQMPLLDWAGRDGRIARRQSSSRSPPRSRTPAPSRPDRPRPAAGTSACPTASPSPATA